MAVKIVVFDLDGTLLSDKSSWRKAHEFFGTEHRGNSALMRYEKGEIDYIEFMEHDLGVWPKGISKKVFDAIFRDYDLSPGAEQTISGLKSRKVKTAVISSGIDILAEVVCERLGIGGCMANGFEFNGEGRLTGKGISRVDPYRKDAVLRSLLEYQSASPEETMGVGDTRFDVKFLEACKYRVAFRPKREDSEILANIVHYMIDDLREILVIIDSVNSTEAEISGRKK